MLLRLPGRGLFNWSQSFPLRIPGASPSTTGFRTTSLRDPLTPLAVVLVIRLYPRCLRGEGDGGGGEGGSKHFAAVDGPVHP